MESGGCDDQPPRTDRNEQATIDGVRQEGGRDLGGEVRLRRDFPPLFIGRTPILPSPFHEFSFSDRSGWRYRPTSPFLDRLGSGRQLRGTVSSTKMVVPPSWTSRIIEPTGGGQQQQHLPRRECDASPTVEGVARKRHRVTIDASPVILPSQRDGPGGSSMATVVSASTAESAASSARASVGASSDGTARYGLPAAVRPGPPPSWLGDIPREVPLAMVPFQKLAPGGARRDGSLLPAPPASSQLGGVASGSAVPWGVATRTNPSGLPSSPWLGDAVGGDSARRNDGSGGGTANGVPPKAALYQLYGRKPRQTQLKPADYVTWDDGGGHGRQPLFTSAFVCPVTGEAFLAGPWGGHSVGAQWQKRVGLYWYPRKVQAEHAAAARAWDCLQLRDGTAGTAGWPPPLLMGGLRPYWPSQRPPWPVDQLPSRVLELALAPDRRNAGLANDDAGGGVGPWNR